MGGAAAGTHRAVYCRETDAFLFASDATGESEIPADADAPAYVEVPNKNDLELGRGLVFRFVEARFPKARDWVSGYFRREGGYGRWKAMLSEHGLLDEWNAFQAEALREAIERWCGENGIQIS